MGNNDTRLVDITLHLLIGDQALPLAASRLVGTEAYLHEYIVLDDAISLEFIDPLNQPVEWLFMGSYSYKNHVYGPLEYAPQVDCLGIDLGLLLPLYDEGICNGIDHTSSHCRLVNAVKYLDVDEFGTE